MSDLNNEIEELFGDEVIDVTLDEVTAILGEVEDNLSTAEAEKYKGVVLDFFSKLAELQNEEEEEEEEEEE
jgi:hypothetical protein